MRKQLAKQNRSLLLFLLLFFVSINSYADWKLVKQLDATYATFVTKSGNILLSDFRIERDGGIYISTNEGDTWTKTNAKDYNYNKFVEVGNYIFAIGYGANIARSADGGHTWTECTYANAVRDIFSEDNMPYTVCYACAYHKNKLYVADFCGGGILYSEDFAQTWKRTDLSSLKYKAEDDDGAPVENTENIYQLVSYKGKLYAFGVYFVFCLDETNNTWKTISDKSNFMAVSTIFDNTLLLGRSVPNDDFKTPFILTLEDEDKWGSLPRPTGIMDNNIRAMASDDTYIYVGLQKGGLFYTSNKGNKWVNFSQGYPKMEQMGNIYLTPTQLFATTNYIYVSVYEPQGVSKKSGLYRFKKTELTPAAGIERANRNKNISIYIDGYTLCSNIEDNVTIDIFDVNGIKRTIALINGKANISFLNNGVYTYKLCIGNYVYKGKLVKHSR